MLVYESSRNLKKVETPGAHDWRPYSQFELMLQFLVLSETSGQTRGVEF